MHIGIIGAGHIGATVGKLWAKAGHSVLFSSRNPEQLTELVKVAGPNTHAGSIQEAAEFGEVILLSVPWGGVEGALTAAKFRNDTIVIDTTNQFSTGGLQHFPGGISALEFNARRAKGARLVKAYNTLTSGFQAESAGRGGQQRVAMPYAGEDVQAKQVVARLISDSGFDPFDVGGWSEAHFIEPPRRPGAFYGEEWNLDTARALLSQLTGYQGKE
jgi:8-hydroxy-5-deazaflavin:NADPH oxidoreductase